MNGLLSPLLASTPPETLEPRAYAAYQQDFGPASPETLFQTAKVIVKRDPHPANAGREYTYWHAVTKGKPETARVRPISDRLVRVHWIRPVINGWIGMRVWWEQRDYSTHWNIWYSHAHYVVIVKALAGGEYLLKTAYPMGYDLPQWHRRYFDAKKAGRALANAP